MGLTQDGSTLLPLVVLAIGIITVLVAIALYWQTSRMRAALRALMRGTNGEDLEVVLNQQDKQLNALQTRIEQIGNAHDRLEGRVSYCLQKLGIVRYNAFSEMGSDLSFSMALLDQSDSGVVVTSLFGRDDSRVYLKPVVSGRSDYPLSTEEAKAIEAARKHGRD